MLSAQLSDKRCMVCDEMATRTTTDAYSNPVCQDINCRTVASKQASMPTFHFRCFLASQRASIQAQRKEKRDELAAKAKIKAEQKALKAKKEAADEISWKEKTRTLVAQKTTANLSVLTIPRGPVKLVPADPKRHAILAQYLTDIIATMESELAADNENTTSAQAESSAPQNLAMGLCTACAGGCCTKGGEAAYLTTQTMHRVLAENPELSTEQLKSLYLAQLPTASMAGSCIYHTPSGCALSRNLRSDTCNAYACDALHALSNQTNNAEHSSVSVLVFQRRQDNWRQKSLDLNNDIIHAYLLSDESVAPVTLLDCEE